MLTNKQIDNRTKKIMALEVQIKELEAQANAVKDEIKAELEARGIEKLETESGRIIRWMYIAGTRFDSKAFKAAEPELYKAYTKETGSYRFTIA